MIEKLSKDLAETKRQMDSSAAEKADADAKLDAQVHLEKRLQDESEELQR